MFNIVQPSACLRCAVRTTASDLYTLDLVVRVGPPVTGGSVSGCPGMWHAVIGRGRLAGCVRAQLDVFLGFCSNWCARLEVEMQAPIQCISILYVFGSPPATAGTLRLWSNREQYVRFWHWRSQPIAKGGAKFQGRGRGWVGVQTLPWMVKRA